MNKLTKPELEQEKTAIESQNNLKQALAKVEKMNKIRRNFLSKKLKIKRLKFNPHCEQFHRHAKHNKIEFLYF